MSEAFASDADLAACRAAIRGGSKSFHAASLLLPARARARAYALYGFCRSADDAVDGGADPDAACRSLAERLDAIYDGRPGPDPVDRAFADVIIACGVPRTVPAALIEGFAWDAAGRRYETISDVRAYGARVAGTVGVMMALVMGARSADALSRACDLGVAMQLTNIARDVGEDARAGRLYLPRAWMREAGLDPDAFLEDPRYEVRLAGVVRRLLEEAERLYARARPGVALLPRGCRPAIHAALRIYREIGREAERAGFDTVSRRVSTTPARKITLAAQGFLDAALAPAGVEAAPLEETRFLLSGAAAKDAEPEPAWWRFGENWGRLAGILHDLEMRERAARDSAALRGGEPG